MAYTRVTEEERKPIYHSRSDDISLREIARCLGWTASSICRELMRNLGLRGYRPKQAHEKAQAQAKRPGPRRFTDKVRADAKEVGNLWRNLQRARRKRRRRCPHQEGRGRGGFQTSG